MKKHQAPDLNALVALFFLAWRGFAAEADAILAHRGLGRVHHRILFAVARMPDLRVGDLATILGVSRQGLHRPLKELRDRELMTVVAPQENRRERIARLTREGAALEDEVTGAQRAQLRGAMKKHGTAVTDGWTTLMTELAQGALAGVPPVAVGAWKEAIT